MLAHLMHPTKRCADCGGPVGLQNLSGFCNECGYRHKCGRCGLVHHANRKCCTVRRRTYKPRIVSHPFVCPPAVVDPQREERIDRLAVLAAAGKPLEVEQPDLT